jgi:RHS repeat-associated protein
MYEIPQGYGEIQANLRVWDSSPPVSVSSTCGATQNNNGRLVTMADGAGSEAYTYDILGRLTQLQKTVNGTVYPIGYGYNLAGSVTSLTYPSGRVIAPSYDAIGRLSAVANGGTNLVSTFVYNALFGPTSVTYANGVSASVGYSSNRGQLTSLTYTKSGQTLFGVTYGYAQSGGNNGQIASVTDSVDSGRNTTYTYDALGRLSTTASTGSANYPAWGLSFTYDRYGNRLSQSVTSGAAPSNSVTVNTATNRITTSGYSYDANGNMTNDGSNTLTFDAENRTLSSSGSLGSATYGYDGRGIRVMKTSSGATSIYIFDGTKVIAEYASGASISSPTREYAYMGGRLLSKFESGATNYYHADRLSSRLLTDSSGNTAAQQGHFPFGESWYLNGSTTKWQFTTYERDGESGNDYAKFRYGVNRLGRFLTGDPVRSDRIAAPQTFNRYSYVANDPISRRDPLGRLADYCSSPDPNLFLDDSFGDDISGFDSGVYKGGTSYDLLQWLWCVRPFNPPNQPEEQFVPLRAAKCRNHANGKGFTIECIFFNPQTKCGFRASADTLSGECINDTTGQETGKGISTTTCCQLVPAKPPNSDSCRPSSSGICTVFSKVGPTQKRH